MKKFILILLLFVSFSAIGQTNRFPSIDSLKAYILKYYRNSTVETFTNLRGQNIAYGTAELLDSLTANMGGVVDSIWKSAGGGSDTLKYSKGGTTYTIGVLSNGAYVPYTGATADVDLGNFGLNAKGISVTGTAGNGHLHLKHQSSAPSSTGSSTTVYADANGNLAYKNDGLNRVTFNGLNITADRTFSFQNKSYTLADSADVAGKQGALTLTTTGSSGAATLVGNTLNIPQYSGGGGGSADSSWVSTETGVQPEMLGELVNSDFSALPSGWTETSPNATVTFSGKMIVSGGVTTSSTTIGNTGSSTIYNNRINMDYYPYSKMRYSFTVVPQDKDASSTGFALHFQANSLFFSTAMQIKFNLTNTADSGKITMDYDLGTAVAGSGNLSHNAGDTLDVVVERDFWLIKASLYNRRTGKYVDCRYSNPAAFGTGGKAYLGLLGGSQHFLSAKVESFDLVNGGAITFIGDSQTGGSGATSEEKIFPLLVMRGNKLKTSNLGNPSLTLSAALTSHVPAAIALNNPVIITLGYNDRRDLSTDTTTFKTRLDAIADAFVAANIPIYGIATPVPKAGQSVNFSIAIRNYCAANGFTALNLDSVLALSTSLATPRENYLSSDAVHWSDSGQIVGANKVIATIGNLIQPFFSDSTSEITFYNVPTGEKNMNQLVIDNRGKVKQIPATTFDAIYNAKNYNGAGTVAQSAEAHISGPYKTDSAVFIHNRYGAYIGHNGGTSAGAGSVGTNILWTNEGAAGIGYPQAFDIITGSGNIKIRSKSLKTGGVATISGSSNLFINSHRNSNVSGSWNTVENTDDIGFTSASNNYGGGKGAFKGVTTGNESIQIYTRAVSDPTFSSSLSNTILLGDFSELANTAFLTTGAGTVSISAFRNVANNFYWGGPVGLGGLNFHARARTTSADLAGWDWNHYASRGTGAGASGTFKWYTYNPAASSSTLHSTTSLELTVDNKKVIIENRFQTSTGADVASANDLTLGSDGNVFTITGSTQINSITTTNWQSGSEIVLIFSGSVTVKNNTAGGANTAVLLLAGGADFSATANDVLKLVYNGTSWFEVSRSVN